VTPPPLGSGLLTGPAFPDRAPPYREGWHWGE